MKKITGFSCSTIQTPIDYFFYLTNTLVSAFHFQYGSVPLDMREFYYTCGDTSIRFEPKLLGVFVLHSQITVYSR